MIKLRKLAARGMLRGMLALPVATMPTMATMCPAPQIRNVQIEAKYENLENIALQTLDEFAKRDRNDYVANKRDPFKDGSKFITYTLKEGKGIEKPVNIARNPDGSMIQVILPYKSGTDESQGGTNLGHIVVEQRVYKNFREITIYVENSYGVKIIEQEGRTSEEYFTVTPDGNRRIVKKPADSGKLTRLQEALSAFSKNFSVD